MKLSDGKKLSFYRMIYKVIHTLQKVTDLSETLAVRKSTDFMLIKQAKEFNIQSEILFCYDENNIKNNNMHCNGE